MQRKRGEREISKSILGTRDNQHQKPDIFPHSFLVLKTYHFCQLSLDLFSFQMQTYPVTKMEMPLKKTLK